MRNLDIQLLHGVGWVTLGVLVAVMMFAILPSSAGATPPKSYLQVGLLDKNDCFYWYSYSAPNHPCWHPSNYGNNTAIDYRYMSGGVNYSAGHSVYLYFTGSGSQHQPFKLFTTSYCKGVEARIYQEGHVGDGAYYKGEARYLHINPRSGVNGLLPSTNFTWLGAVHNGPEVAGCAWTGPHLHQDANDSYFTPFYTNWTGNHPWKHSHVICWSGSCP
jgi:hypothetical protein